MQRKLVVLAYVLGAISVGLVATLIYDAFFYRYRPSGEFVEYADVSSLRLAELGVGDSARAVGPFRERMATWSSSDTSVVEVTVDGILIGRSPGVATVTARSPEGEFAVGGVLARQAKIAERDTIVELWPDNSLPAAYLQALGRRDSDDAGGRILLYEIIRDQGRTIDRLADQLRGRDPSRSPWEKLFFDWRLWASCSGFAAVCFVALLAMLHGAPPEKVVEIGNNMKAWWAAVVPWRPPVGGDGSGSGGNDNA